MNNPPPEIIERLKLFLEEDIRSGDITTKSMGPLKTAGVATIFSKGESILAGIEEVIAIAELTGLTCEVQEFEGNWVHPGNAVMRLKGPASTLLQIERVSLNIVQRMSGIATKVYKMVQIAKKENPKIIVAATRKTTPGFRYFEKRAVQVGGGDTHRYALDDMVLIKNNHISVMGGVGKAVRAAKSYASYTKKVSCETRNLEETLEAIDAGADIVLLDNFTPEGIKKVHEVLVKREIRDRVILEASGGINDDNIRAYAASGVDVISSGALTHSYKSSDFNMILSLK